MRNNLKALYLAFIIAALSMTAYNNKSIADDETAVNPQLEIIKESREKKPVMQTRKWNTPDYGNKDKKAEENKDVASENKKEETSDESELTTEQRIWNRYKKLAEGDAKDGDNTTSSKEKNSNDDQEKIASNDKGTSDQNADAPPPEAQDEQEKQATGLAAILQRYKKSQQSKRNMQTRSLGSID